MLLRFSAVLVGGGPAGLAVLLASNKEGRLAELLQRGLLIVEQSSHLGRGQIGNYSINSDSTGYTFVEPLRVGDEPALREILDTPVAQRIAAANQNPIPLREAGELMELIGQAIHTVVSKYPRSAIFTSCSVESAQRLPDGTWQLIATDSTGTKIIVQAERVILATGATQPKSRLQQEKVAGVPVVERWGDRLMQSGEVVGAGGFDQVTERLKDKAAPRVAILGGSTSAMAVAHALLNRLPVVNFKEGGVTLFHRRPLRVYYTSVEEALANGYTEFDSNNDLCPITKRVYRLAGLRLDSRELLMQLRGIGGRKPEPRMKLHLLLPEDPEAVRLIDSADLVVAALGYRPNALTILNSSGEALSLFAHTGPAAPLVDGCCRVIDSLGAPIEGLFGIGLAAGFVPHGTLGGEPSFVGQANGLWLWQNDIGAIVVRAILAPSEVDTLPTRVRAVRKYPVESPAGQINVA